MSPFRDYPRFFEDLFDREIFLEAVVQARKRLRDQTGIDFELSDINLPTLHELWFASVAQHRPRIQKIERRLQSDDARLKFQLYALERAMEYLCYLMQTLPLITGINFCRDPHHPYYQKFRLLKGYESQFFALQFSYECYRYYASRATQKVSHNRLAGWRFDNIISICKQMRESPRTIRTVFREFLSEF